MKTVKSIPKLLIVIAIVGAAGFLVWALFDTGSSGGGSASSISLNVPEFSAIEAGGKAAFDANCAKCHGPYGSGTDKGPPFMHAVYNPGHHSDESFRRAVRQGVRQHHWRFGDMPAQPQVTDRELMAIVAFVRAMQKANGIVYQQHQM